MGDLQQTMGDLQTKEKEAKRRKRLNLTQPRAHEPELSALPAHLASIAAAGSRAGKIKKDVPGDSGDDLCGSGCALAVTGTTDPIIIIDGW